MRISRKAPVELHPSPKRVGVDDFAFRKERRYGTIIIDLDKRQPIDLLPDREGKTLEAWFRDHPGVELVTRDRSSVYANAITNACPDAVQVADRWHLLANLSEVVERFLDTQREAINQSILATMPLKDTPAPAQLLTEEQLPPFLTWDNDLSKLMTSSGQERSSKRLERYEKVKQLQAQGHRMRSDGRCRNCPAFGHDQKHGQTLLASGQVCTPSDVQTIQFVTV